MIVKRVSCIVISLVMIVLMLPVCGNVDGKAKKLRLNYSYYKMTGGYTVKLRTRSGAKAKWKSTNKKIATVSKNGKVIGRKKGKCYIVARIGKRVGKCKMTITSNMYIPNKLFTRTSLNVLRVKLDVNTIEYNELGESIIVKKKNSYPLVLKNTNKKATWRSDNTRVATVSSSGEVTPVSVGTTYVHAVAGKKDYKCEVVVTDLKDPNLIEKQKDSYEMLRRINNLRMQNHVKPLKILNRLMRASNKRAQEVRPNKIEVIGLGIKLDKNFAHFRPDGRSFSTIFKEFNLPLGNQMGENISFVTDTVRRREEFLNTCFQAFLDSDSHRRNMLDKDYDYIGIGHDDSIHFINYHTHPCIAMFWDQLFYTK
ncbi:MAG: Ig-like domain-containing protein [Eubacterium sp.]|nr:Ig-like domain-containing protein [Eubacterium sp.]